MDRHLRTAELEQAIEDALAGARSLRLTGWMAEECEAAALERIARYWPDGPSEGWSHDQPHGRTAFLMGKRAAVDELRRLTRWRRTVHMREVPFETDEASGNRPDLASTESGYEVVELEDQLARGTARLRPRDQRITLALARGFSAREIAAVFRVSPSIVSVALRRVRTNLRWT
jgi:DNA-directed RNA polymerase specialized sigma24 family protein